MPEIWPQWAVQNWLIIGTALGAMEANMPGLLTGCDSDELVGNSHPATYTSKRGTPTFLYTAYATRLNISADL